MGGLEVGVFGVSSLPLEPERQVVTPKIYLVNGRDRDVSHTSLLTITGQREVHTLSHSVTLTQIYFLV